jgi:hypothetical protein
MMIEIAKHPALLRVNLIFTCSIETCTSLVRHVAYGESHTSLHIVSVRSI